MCANVNAWQASVILLCFQDHLWHDLIWRALGPGSRHWRPGVPWTWPIWPGPLRSCPFAIPNSLLRLPLSENRGRKRRKRRKRQMQNMSHGEGWEPFRNCQTEVMGRLYDGGWSEVGLWVSGLPWFINIYHRSQSHGSRKISSFSSSRGTGVPAETLALLFPELGECGLVLCQGRDFQCIASIMLYPPAKRLHNSGKSKIWTRRSTIHGHVQ